MVWGDIVSKTSDIPIFIKVRKAGNNYPIPLQVFNYKVHWGDAIKIHNNELKDRLWNDKLDKVIWRGAATNTIEGVRLSFVEQYFNYSEDTFDVGFSEHGLCLPEYNRGSDCKIYEDLSKRFVGKDEMLKSKYIISLEGNDVATNLKWLLYSNSCPIMPIPTRESWAMESLLKPYVHFVPISFNGTTKKWNLEQQYQFCLDNDDLCNEIAQNGKQFILENKFLDIEHESYLQQRILDLYCQQYRIM